MSNQQDEAHKEYVLEAQAELRDNENYQKEYDDHRESIYWAIKDSANNVDVIASALINALSTDELSQVINRINKKNDTL